MIVTLCEKAWQCGRETADSMLKTARQKYIADGKNAIYGVEKEGKLDMCRDEFESISKLKECIRLLKSQGFKVYYVKRGDVK